MTEAEIMKALEICSQNDTNKHYMMTYHGMPLHILFEAIVDLINRKNAEIERLKYCNAANVASVATLLREKETARSEAIKEFLGKAEKRSSQNATIHLSKLDEIAKEMGVE